MPRRDRDLCVFRTARTEDPPSFRYLRYRGGHLPAVGQGYQFAVETEPGIQVLLTMFGNLENVCRRLQGAVTLFVGQVASAEDCVALPWLQDRIRRGEKLLTADLRGTGQNFPTTCGSQSLLDPYGSDYMYASYASMMGETYLGWRVYNLLRTVDFLTEGGATGMRVLCF